jgi:RNA polymerase sigma-70 factor (ECF subfamily)
MRDEMVKNPSIKNRLTVVPRFSEESDRFCDDDLMQLIQAGRQEAFELLIRRYQQMVVRLATYFLGDFQLGMDVTQDVFLALWAERDRYKPQGKFRSFLISCTIHRCHKVVRQATRHQRKINRLKSQPQPDEQHRQIPLDRILEEERARKVRKLLVRLSEKQKRVLILHYTNEMSLQEISALTKQPVGTVKSHLFRGMRRLHKLFSKEPK